MKKTLRLLLVFVAAVAIAPSLHRALAQGNSAEEEVWKLEEDYWRYVKALDATAYRTLWHERFVGWPSVSQTPAEKRNIWGWVQARVDKGQTLKSYELRRMAVREIQGAVVVHYMFKAVWVDKAGKLYGENEWNRITHTWMKTGGKWLIVTGMGASMPPKE